MASPLLSPRRTRRTFGARTPCVFKYTSIASTFEFLVITNARASCEVSKPTKSASRDLSSASPGATPRDRARGSSLEAAMRRLLWRISCGRNLRRRSTRRVFPTSWTTSSGIAARYARKFRKEASRSHLRHRLECRHHASRRHEEVTGPAPFVSRGFFAHHARVRRDPQI